MKRPTIWMAGVFVVLAILMVAIGLFYGYQKDIIRTYTVNRDARKAYHDGRYGRAYNQLEYLVDSLRNDQEAAELNLAHAGYRYAWMDTASNTARNLAKNNLPLDTASRNQMQDALARYGTQDHYREVAAKPEQKVFASVASNQLGVIAWHMRPFDDPDQEAAAMLEATEYFKAALKTNPSNDAARYNYELIRRRMDYPQMVMAKVKSLVHQQRYRDARTVLEDALEKDYRMKMGYGDYVERLENVIRIDSLSRS